MIKKELLYSLFTEKAIEYYIDAQKTKTDNDYYKDDNKGTQRNFSGEVGVLTVAVDGDDILHEFCTSYKTNTMGIIKHSTRQNLLHSHNYYELTLVVNGCVEVQIENNTKQYKKGDVYLSDRKIHHTETYSQDACAVFFCISKEFFLDFLECINTESSADKFNEFFKGFKTGMEKENSLQKIYWDFYAKNQDNIHNYLHNVVAFKLELLSCDVGYRLILFGLLKRLLYIITNENFYTFNLNPIKTPVKDSITKEVKRYIETKRRKIMREELERDLHYNVDYLNRIFKKEYGLTIGQYQRKVCMNEAASILLRTNSTIGEVAEQLGFCNRSQFYKLFYDNFNMTPQEYRKKLTKGKNE